MNRGLLRVIRISVTLPAAILFLFFMRVMRPVLLIRVGSLKSDRIGHFVLETDLMLLEQQAGVSTMRQRTLDIFYAPKPIANAFVYRMWKRKLRILPSWCLITVYRINSLLPDGKVYQVPSATSTCLDVHNLIDRFPANLSLTKKEYFKGIETLEKMGLREGDRFVCMIARDGAYLRRSFPGRDFSYHDYRNCEIDDYRLGAESLANRGLYVFRMGSVVEKPLVSSNPRVIDYASSEYRSDFMDIFIGARCEFCVSDGLGFYAIPAAFRRPNAYVNYSPFFMFYSSRACDLGIAKTLTDRATGKRLSLSEMKLRRVAGLSKTQDFENAGVLVTSNSPEEIEDLMIEMLDRIEGKWQSEDGDDERQNMFWQRFHDVIGEELRLRCHGEFRAHYGAKFLRNNPDWLH